jgi:mannose-6-phosphate isomerase-like protein (cupin superfamily)
MSFTGPLRRVVTGHDADGKAIIVADGPPSRVYDDLGEEGLVFHEIWHTTETPAQIDRDTREADEDRLLLAPPTNGVRLRVLDIPPEAEGADLDTVFENIGATDAKVSSERHRSFHRTETIDFGIVLSGEIVLLMDEGQTTVRPGEIVVQRGTNHGWANYGHEPCRIAFVLIDGAYTDGLAAG